MRNLYNLNRAVAGHYVEISNESLNVMKGETHFSLQTDNNEFSYYIDSIETKIESKILKCSINGWAYTNKNSTPAKSIYVTYNNKIISGAKPTRRIDVRANMDLSFDHCGFSCEFNLPDPENLCHIVSIIMVSNNKVQVHSMKIINRQELNNQGLLSILLDKSVVRTNKPSFEYRIESAAVQDGLLRLKGWCFFREDPQMEVYINFFKSGVALGETTFQSQSRPDVITAFELNHDHGFVGFDYLSHKLNELPINHSDQSIDVLFTLKTPNKKELIRI